MPIHDWKKVDAGIFHDFHLSWIVEIARALNQGLLPSDHYALSGRLDDNFGPDARALQQPIFETEDPEPPRNGGAVSVFEAPPRLTFRGRSEIDAYAARARTIIIRHEGRHNIVAMIQTVAPGNKIRSAAMAAFSKKMENALLSGINLAIVDLFPPTARDPEGIHRAIWGEGHEDDFALPADKPLTCVSHVGYPAMRYYLDPVAVGDELPDLPVFLTPERYVPLPLEATYQAAWAAMPEFWREVIEAPAGDRAEGPR